MKIKKLIFLLGMFFFCFCFQSFYGIKIPQENITQVKAILLAETFVKENGYTLSKPNRSKLKFEGYDNQANIDEVLNMRYNNFYEKAFCISEDVRGWHVGFLSTSVDIKKMTKKQKQSDLSGRAVFVSKNGKEIYIMHKDPRFSFFKKLEFKK